MPSIYDAVSAWNPATTYAQHSIVSGSDLTFYYSLVNSNFNNNPTSTLQTRWDGQIIRNGARLPNFYWKPSYTSTINKQPKITKLQFGNGYQQRISDSLNFNLAKFDLSFDNRNEEESVAILHFLEQRGGKEAFIYDMPTIYDKTNFTTEFICSDWSVSFNSFKLYSIKATFEEVPA